MKFSAVFIFLFVLEFVNSNLQFAIDYENRILSASQVDLKKILKEIEGKERLREEIKRKRRKKRSAESTTIEESNINLGNLYSYSIIRPRCIPLKSSNLNANPYHPKLVSQPSAEIRFGLAPPILLEQVNPVQCPGPVSSESSESSESSASPCSLHLTKSTTIEFTESISISSGISQILSKQIGNSSSMGRGDTVANSISKSIEDSVQKSITLTDDQSVSDSLSHSLQNTNEKSSGISIGDSKEFSVTNTLTHETSDTNTDTVEITSSETVGKDVTSSTTNGGSKSTSIGTSRERSINFHASATAGFKFFGIQSSVTVGGGFSNSNSESRNEVDEKNWSNTYGTTDSSSKTSSNSNSHSKASSVSKGKSTSDTYNHGSSSTKDNRVSDSISLSKEAGRTLAQSKSNSSLVSDTQSNSYRIDNTFTSSQESSIQNTFGIEHSNSKNEQNETSRSFRRSVTFSQDYSFTIEPGSCKALACSPVVKSVAVPYECIIDDDETNSKNKKFELFHVDFMYYFQPENITCVYTLVDCNDMDKKLNFEIANEEFKETDKNNKKTFYFSNVWLANDESPLLTSSVYKLVLSKKGSLTLLYREKPVWDNGMGYFEGYEIRIRINEKGHLVEEIKGLFNKSAPGYRDDWITVWSSAPINHNVTIGIPNLYDSHQSYKLILENSGALNLYDAVGAVIWCVQKGCQHRMGYQFPEVYLVPTNILTPELPGDTHNSISPDVSLRNNQTRLNSLEVDCSLMNVNEGLVSPNGRFKLILEKSGNLIIKDDFRTMWESSSGYLRYAKPPYQLAVAPIGGNIFILDSHRHIVWMSIVNFKGNITRPFYLEILDEGKLVVVDASNQIIWDSWATGNSSLGRTFFQPLQYNYEKCFEKFIKKIIKSDNRTDNQLKENQILISQNLLWDFKFEVKKSKTKFFLARLKMFEIDGVVDALVLEENGNLIAYDKNKIKLWSLSSESEIENGPFRLIIANSTKICVLSIINKYNNVIWSYPFNTKDKLSINGLSSDGRDKLSTPDMDENSETFNSKLTEIYSPNGNWSLCIEGRKIVRKNNGKTYGTPVFVSKKLKSVESLTLLNNSNLLLKGRDNDENTQSEILVNSNSSPPYQLTINNDGVVLLKNSLNNTIWQDKPLFVKSFLNSQTQPVMFDNEIIESEDKQWYVGIVRENLHRDNSRSFLSIVYKHALVDMILFNNSNKYNLSHLSLENGTLHLYDEDKKSVWNTSLFNMTSNTSYTAIVTNEGDFRIYNGKKFTSVAPEAASVPEIHSNFSNGFLLRLNRRYLLHSSNNKERFQLEFRQKKGRCLLNILDKGKVVSNFYNGSNLTDHVILEKNGDLVFNSRSSEELQRVKVFSAEENGPFTLLFDKEGNLTIQNRFKCAIWRHRKVSDGLSARKSLINGEGLKSNNLKWEFSLIDEHKLVIKRDNILIEYLYNNRSQPFCSLFLDQKGNLSLLDYKKSVLWSTSYDKNSFKVTLNNQGLIEFFYENSSSTYKFEQSQINRLNSDIKNESVLTFYKIMVNGLYSFGMQLYNGNYFMSIRKNKKNKIILFISNSEKIESLVMEKNGNLILFDEKNKSCWESNSGRVHALPPYILQLNNESVLEIRNKMNTIVWHYPRNGSYGHLDSTGLNELSLNENLSSPNGKWKLNFLNETHLVLQYNNVTLGNFLTSFNEIGLRASSLKINEYGKLNLYNNMGHSIWNSNFEGDIENSPYRVILNNYGEFMVVDSKDEPKWKQEIELY